MSITRYQYQESKKGHLLLALFEEVLIYVLILSKVTKLGNKKKRLIFEISLRNV